MFSMCMEMNRDRADSGRVPRVRGDELKLDGRFFRLFVFWRLDDNA